MNNIYNSLAWIFYPILLLSICFLLPSDVLDKVQPLNNLIDFLKNYMPALNHFEENARFPGRYQVALVTGLLCLPLQALFVFKSDLALGTKKIGRDAYAKTLYKNTLLSLLVFIGISAYFLVRVYGLDIESSSKYARTIRAVMFNRVYFSAFTSMVLFFLGLLIAAFYIFSSSIFRNQNKF